MIRESREGCGPRQIQHDIIRIEIHCAAEVFHSACVIIQPGARCAAKRQRLEVDRINGESAIEIFEGAGKISQFAIGETALDRRFQKIRFDPDGLIEIFNGVAKTPLRCLQLASQIPAIRVVQPQLDAASKIVIGQPDLVVSRPGFAPREIELWSVKAEARRARIIVNGFAPFLARREREPALKVGFGVRPSPHLRK